MLYMLCNVMLFYLILCFLFYLILFCYVFYFNLILFDVMFVMLFCFIGIFNSNFILFYSGTSKTNMDQMRRGIIF